MLRLVKASFIGLLVLSTGCFSAGSAADGTELPAEGKVYDACSTPEDAYELADQLLQIANLERAAAGLTPVVLNDRLEKAAGTYACRMIDEGFFDHYDPINGRGPGERAVVFKYVFYSIGENLAVGQETPADVMKLWMESPSHREIILDPDWKDAGVAVRYGGEYQVYWVIEFADPVVMTASGLH